MMPIARRRKLAGQALVIFVLSIMALTGLLVIAVDGGMIYLDKRRLQNAADAAALAGGDATENLPLANSYTSAHQAALNEIYHNLFPGTTVPTVPAGAAASYTTTAQSGTYQFVLTASVAAPNWDTYRAVINHAYVFFAAGAIGFGPSSCTLGATTTNGAICLQAHAKMLAGTYPFALILLDDQNTQNENLSFNGNNGKLVLHDGGTKGGAFSNESMDASHGSVYFNPCGTSGDLWAVNESATGGASSATPAHTYGYQGDSETYPCINHPGLPYPKSSIHIPFPNYPEPTVCSAPSCTVTTPLTASGGTYYLCPGTYSGTLSESSGGSTIYMYPGVYRFTAQIAMSLSGGTIENAGAGQYPPPNGATLINCAGYNTTTPPANGDYGIIVEFKPPDCTQSGFQVSGQSNLIFHPSPKYNNISFYIENNGAGYPGFGCSTNTPAGTHMVNITGNANINIYGAFYGPGDNMFFCGNGSGYGVGQIIAWTMQVCGNGSIDEHYNPAYLPYFRGLIE